MNTRNRNTCSVAWGAFDLLHGGHLQFLRWARATEKCYLHVVVLPDTAIRHAKGHRPIQTEQARRRNVYQTGLVDAVSIDAIESGLDSIRSTRWTQFLLGSDQPTRWVNVAESIVGQEFKVVRCPLSPIMHTSEFISMMGANRLREIVGDAPIYGCEDRLRSGVESVRKQSIRGVVPTNRHPGSP